MQSFNSGLYGRGFVLFWNAELFLLESNLYFEEVAEPDGLTLRRPHLQLALSRA